VGRYICQDTVQDRLGNALGGVTVTVYLANSSSVASIYTAISGGSAVVGSTVESDSNGKFYFYIDDSEYPPTQRFKLTFTKTGYSIDPWDYIEIIPDNTHLYYVDATATDQGAATTRADRSIKDLVDAIGTSKKATIILPHSGSGNTTTYTLSTDETIPSNIKLKPENGSIVSIGSGKTLTIAGTIEADDEQQIFSGSVLFTGSYQSKISVCWFGAFGDNSTDYATEINLAIIAANSCHATLYFPPGTYRLTPGATTSIQCPVYGPQANIAAYDSTDSYLIYVDYITNKCSFEIQALMGYDVAYHYTEDAGITSSGTGLYLQSALYSTFKIGRVVGFTNGVFLDSLSANTHSASCRFLIGEVRHNTTGILLRGGSGGVPEAHWFWVNFFYDNRSVAIQFTEDGYPVAMNYFWVHEMGLAADDDQTGINMIGEVEKNHFRILSITPPTGTGKIIETDGDSHDNIFELAYYDFDKITAPGGNVFNTHAVGVGYPGVDLNGARSIIFGSAAPSAATWRQGDICFNTGAAAEGTVGWVCTTAGTPGTWKAFGTIAA